MSSNLRRKQISLNSDTFTLDTLSIVPGSLRIALPSGQPVTDTTFFKLLPAEGKLVINRKAMQEWKKNLNEYPSSSDSLTSERDSLITEYRSLSTDHRVPVTEH